MAAVEARLNAHLDKVIKVPRLLESTGTQPLKRKEVIRNIGELMLLREAVNFRGGGLEDTPEVWLDLPFWSKSWGRLTDTLRDRSTGQNLS